MTKQEVINSLCSLVTTVGNKVYKENLPHDCFCKRRQKSSEVEIHPEIVAFIINAVNTKIGDVLKVASIIARESTDKP